MPDQNPGPANDWIVPRSVERLARQEANQTLATSRRSEPETKRASGVTFFSNTDTVTVMIWVTPKLATLCCLPTQANTPLFPQSGSMNVWRPCHSSGGLLDATSNCRDMGSATGDLERCSCGRNDTGASCSPSLRRCPDIPPLVPYASITALLGVRLPWSSDPLSWVRASLT